MKFKRAWWLLLLLIPAVVGWMRLRFEAEILDLLPANISAVEGLKLYQRHFAGAQDLIITVEAPDADTATAVAQALAEALRMHSNLVAGVTWQPPWLENPAQAAELIASLWLNQPPLRVSRRQISLRLLWRAPGFCHNVLYRNGGHVGLGVAGAHGVHRYAGLGKLHRHRAG